MSVYVDAAVFPWRKRMWCHLEADTLEELHQFAQRLGLKREWFQDKPAHPHYDITSSVRQRAVRLGAIEMSSEQMVTFWKRQSDARRAGRCKSSTDAKEFTGGYVQMVATSSPKGLAESPVSWLGCGDVECDGWHQCLDCEGEGMVHNCGEDCCACLDPDTQDRVTCQHCNGKGGFPCPPE